MEKMGTDKCKLMASKTEMGKKHSSGSKVWSVSQVVHQERYEVTMNDLI